MTVADLKKKGANALNDAQLKALIVGKAFWLRNNVTGEQFSENFTDRGSDDRVPRRSERRHAERLRQRRARRLPEERPSAYKIEGGKLITFVSQDPYSFTFYKLGDTYYAARSNEFGYANYEIIPPPQIASNPLTELSNQFSIELGLTEEQKKQIVPILKEEIKQLGALKKDTALSGLQKVEQLRQASAPPSTRRSRRCSIAEQQPKFQAMREQLRRRIIEQMAEKAFAKAKSEVESWFADVHEEKKR